MTEKRPTPAPPYDPEGIGNESFMMWYVVAILLIGLVATLVLVSGYTCTCACI